MEASRTKKNRHSAPLQPAKWKRNWRQMIMIIPRPQTHFAFIEPRFLTGKNGGVGSQWGKNEEGGRRRGRRLVLLCFFSFWKSACRTYYCRAVPLPNATLSGRSRRGRVGGPLSPFSSSHHLLPSNSSLTLSLSHSPFLPPYRSAFVRLLIIKGLVLGWHRRR